MKRLRWHVAVLIPARDEEALLPRCLRSVQAARRRLPSPVSSDIVLVSDCSQDRTHAIAEELIRQTGVVLCTAAGNVGSARKLAADTALSRYAGAADRCWLANTDADCEVPEDWLLTQLALANNGVSAVAGIVDVDSFEEHSPFVEQRFRRSYHLHPDGTHPHVHAANLGMRADVYLKAGGWAELPTAEDHDLWHRLALTGHQRLSHAPLRVVTSGRRIGRAPLGFAGALAAHNGVAA